MNAGFLAAVPFMFTTVHLAETVILGVTAFVFGAVLGSWLNVCIHRFPRHESVYDGWKSLWYPPSICPKCTTPVNWSDNIPLVSWLLLRGRCRACRAVIPFRYFLVELLTALLFVATVLCELPAYGHFPTVLDHPFSPASIWPLGSNNSPLWLDPRGMILARLILHLLLILALVAATFIDFDLLIIPDSVTLPLMATAVLAHTILGCVFIVPVWFHDPGSVSFAEAYSLVMGQPFRPEEWPGWVSAWFTANGLPDWIRQHPHLHGFVHGVAGIVVGGGIVWGVRAVGYWTLRREAMGFGDVVLLAMIGSVLGWQAALLVFVLAPFCALIVAAISWFLSGDREIPFGPYLSLATLIVMFAFQGVWRSFAGVFALSPVLPILVPAALLSLAIPLLIVKRVQRHFGWDIEPAPPGEWLSGDQLAYLAGECSDPEQGKWRVENTWPGVRSGRGQLAVDSWRNPKSPFMLQRFQKR
jgi:leader peptidase (prepilin peptidase)/N-methyltransferase